jgi:hypothetical protein
VQEAAQKPKAQKIRVFSCKTALFEAFQISMDFELKWSPVGPRKEAVHLEVVVFQPVAPREWGT